MSIDNLSHTSWKCKYHIVFAPKYRRQVVYQQIKTDIGHILRQLCERKKVEIAAAETCPDHKHAYQYFSEYQCIPVYGVSERKSSLLIF